LEAFFISKAQKGTMGAEQSQGAASTTQAAMSFSPVNTNTKSETTPLLPKQNLSN
jgi:hypothetical protein